MSNIVKIGEAEINVDVFKGYNKDAQDLLTALEQKESEFNDLVDMAAEDANIKPAVVKAYFKARFADKTSVTVERGELFDALDNALDK